MKLIYFDVDTLRYDHLSCYGYSQKTPNIDALANDGVKFANAYASNTPCMPARAALFTGCFGVKNGVVTHGESACKVKTDEKNALARVLCENGVDTVTVSSFGRHPAPWFYNGFSHAIDPSYKCKAENFQRFDGIEINNAAIEFLKSYNGENLFLHLHYWDPHGPLTPPKEWIDYSYNPDTSYISDCELNKLVASGLYRGGKHLKISSRDDLQELLRLYDAEIQYTDFLIGQMCNYLKQNNYYDDAVIILSADHGEQYGEAQMILEHGTVHNSCVKIPLLLKMPKNELAGQICDNLVYALDIAPTAVEAFKAKAPASWDGISLNQAIDKSFVREYLICEHGLYTCQRAVVYKNFKMVHTYSAGLWSFPEFALYNIKNDYSESKDIKNENPTVFSKLCEFEQNWLKRILNGQTDALCEVGKHNGQHGLKVAKAITEKLLQE